jgi:hypothetical protein
MHALVIPDVALNVLVVLMMPVIIWANLTQRARHSPVNAYLWREHPGLVRTSLVFLAMLVVYSAIELLGEFGIAAKETVDMAGMLIGIPMLMLSLAITALVLYAGVKAARCRPGETEET